MARSPWAVARAAAALVARRVRDRRMEVCPRSVHRWPASHRLVQVERMDLQGAQGHGQAGRGRARAKHHAEVLGTLEDGRLAEQSRSALTAGMLSENCSALRTRSGAPFLGVEVGGRVAAAEVGGHVHEHRGRRQRAVVDAGRVGEGLEGGARLPPTGGEDVELRLHLPALHRGSSWPSRHRR